MHTYVKFLKKILSKKRRLKEHEVIAMTAMSSVMIQSMPHKLKDLRSFSISCHLGTLEFERVLYDLWANVSLMPIFMCKSLGMREIKSTNVSLQLVDRLVKYPFNLLEDVPMKNRTSLYTNRFYYHGY